MIQNLIFRILFLKILLRACNAFIFIHMFQWTSSEFFFNFQIFQQKVSKPTKAREKDHSIQFTVHNTVSLKKPHSGRVVQWLSLLHNFIQRNLKSGSEQVKILFAACWRFAMVRISTVVPAGNKAKRLSSVNHTTKTIHHHHHHHSFYEPQLT